LLGKFIKQKKPAVY